MNCIITMGVKGINENTLTHTIEFDMSVYRFHIIQQQKKNETRKSKARKVGKKSMLRLVKSNNEIFIYGIFYL